MAAAPPGRAACPAGVLARPPAARASRTTRTWNATAAPTPAGEARGGVVPTDRFLDRSEAATGAQWRGAKQTEGSRRRARLTARPPATEGALIAARSGPLVLAPPYPVIP